VLASKQLLIQSCLALHSQQQQVQQVQPVAELEPMLRLLGQELELEQELVQQLLAQRLLQHHH
jgi:hypothetical protein